LTPGSALTSSVRVTSVANAPSELVANIAATLRAINFFIWFLPDKFEPYWLCSAVQTLRLKSLRAFYYRLGTNASSANDARIVGMTTA
jgi:hypothetical protein